MGITPREVNPNPAKAGPSSRTSLRSRSAAKIAAPKPQGEGGHSQSRATAWLANRPPQRLEQSPNHAPAGTAPATADPARADRCCRLLHGDPGWRDHFAG